MQFTLTEEQRLIQDTARRIAKDVVAPRAAELDITGEYPHDIFGAFKASGFTGLTIPQQYGGSGAGMFPLALAVEEVAKYCCASGLMLLLSALPSQPVMLGGDEKQKQWIGKGIASGDMKGAFCLTEPNRGSDAGNLEARAVKDGDDYVINGEKIFVTSGERSDCIVVWATLDKSLGRAAIKSFVVEKGTPGVKVERLEEKLGIRASDTAVITFTDARVPKENLLGSPEINVEQGFAGAMATFDNTRPLVAAMAAIDPDALSPRDALDQLYQLKKLATRTGAST